ncbi:hypothetical protein SYNTR_1201 [Candidatus Syntrophocurvum alkaliphilum]|uniref:GGDEF domain-containing protein n=1 Tax=Candidatus Syntrophocurvum alkaliphilum TaxID=2293317 RepID=A0A6I6DIY2_9FIRM|nr:hypothetical protein [Candidatus Syntrophocurvum alkaliphilum]QGT99794.1 hypothetical protein SYNTR_1201 [Candidatus Syntrophocurvum alkaliphilum]
MYCIDWFKLKRDGIIEKIAKEKQIPNEAIKWQDPLTKTNYYLKKEDLKIIKDEIKQYFSNYIKSNSLHKGYKDLINNQNTKLELINLILDVPAQALEPERAKGIFWPWIDWIQIRIGLVYALLNKSDREQWDEKIRDFLLSDCLGELGDFANKDNNLVQMTSLVDNCITGKSESKNLLHEVDIVKYSAVKVKEYFLETNKLPNIRGASRILDILNRERIPHLIGNLFVPESVVYAGGGSVLAIVPAGEGKRLTQEIETLHRQVSVTAQCSTAHITINIAMLWLGEKYRRTLAKLEEQLKRRQRIKIPIIHHDNNLNDINAGLSDENDKITDSYSFCKDDTLCSHCNMRKAYKKRLLDEEEYLCSSCYHRVLAGAHLGRKSYYKEYFYYCELNSIPKPKELNLPQHLEGLAKQDSNNNHIALIYADGNNMGQIVMSLDNLVASKTFSDKTEKVTKEAVYKALSLVMPDLKAEIIALGGDDVLMYVPASRAISLTVQMGKFFDDSFRNLSSDKEAITLSAGVVIARYNFPLIHMFDNCKALLKNAKKRSQVLREKEKKNGTLDLMVIESSGSFTDDILSLRKEKANLLKSNGLMPLTWLETEALTDAIHILSETNDEAKSKKSLIYRFMQAQLQMTREEFKLYYLYNVWRLKNKERERIVSALNKIQIGFNFISDEPFFKKGMKDEILYTPWSDMLEIWSYTEDSPKVGDEKNAN